MPKPVSERQRVDIAVTINGREAMDAVEPRLLLSDYLRHQRGLTGTHVGCEHGVCGACTVLIDGEAARSCLVFAVQVDGCAVRTVEGLAPPGGAGGPGGDRVGLHLLQEAFRQTHGLQCGYCTPGLLMSLIPFLDAHPDPSEDQIRAVIAGHLCRCTGYFKIVEAVKLASRMRAQSGT